MEYLILFIIILLSAIAESSLGFGFSIIFISISAMFLPLHTCIAVGIICLLFLSPNVIFRIRKFINIKKIIAPAISALIGRSFGMLILLNITDTIVKTIIGIILIVLSIYAFFFSEKIKIKANIRNGIIAGLVSGLMGGLANIGGPALVVYYLSSSETKEEYSANIQLTYFIGNLYSFILHLINGSYTIEVLKFSGMGVIAVMLGAFTGMKLFSKLNKKNLNKLVYSFMIIAGIMLIF